MARQTTSQKKAQAEAKSGEIIIITAKADGFRRCGMAHSAQPTEHAIDDFSAKELERLRSEPMLIVQSEPKS